jgi:hypothetical protein
MKSCQIVNEFYISNSGSGTVIRITKHDDVMFRVFRIARHQHSPTGSKNVEVVLVGRQRYSRMSPFDQGHLGRTERPPISRDVFLAIFTFDPSTHP